MDNHSYADLHCHPGLKTFLTADTEPQRTPCWKNIHLGWFSRLFDQLFLASMLWSNSSLSQLIKGRVFISVVGLYAYEEGMITGRVKFLWKIKKLNLLHVIESLNKILFKDISGKLLRRVSSNSCKYYDIFLEVQNHLFASKSIDSRYELPDNYSHLVPDKLNVILSIEGGHNLFSLDKSDPGFYQSVLDNIKLLKSSGYRYLFLGLAHLENSPLCTHAYGMKMIDDDRFRPEGDGISQLGKDVIRKALEEEPYRMLIDLKHMSLWSRLQYYRMLKEDPELQGKNIPLIMSHAGIAGVPYSTMPVRKCEYIGKWFKVVYYKKHGLMKTDFNPWSINLYDEEIPLIIGSNGIIGINLDERILGTKQTTAGGLTEYFSEDEFCHYLPMIKKNFGVTTKKLNKPVRGPGKWFSSYRDIKYICNSILHIVLIGGERAWNHICIGSDFDGMINPIEFYQDSTKYDKLRKDLAEWLPRMAASDPDKNNQYYINNNIDQLVEGIMCGNATLFLKRYF